MKISNLRHIRENAAYHSLYLSEKIKRYALDINGFEMEKFEITRVLYLVLHEEYALEKESI